MYKLPCRQCHQPYPRVVFRKRGGGVHATCPACRKIAYNEKAYLVKKIKVLVVQQEQERAARQQALRRKQLTHEHKQETGVNRYRIRIMSGAVKPTKATRERLAVRLKVQKLWDDGLQVLLQMVDEGRAAPNLHEYMEGRQNDIYKSSDPEF